MLACLVLLAVWSGATTAEGGQPGYDLSRGLALLAEQQTVTATELFSDLGRLVKAQGRVDRCHPEFGLDGVPPINVTASIVSAVRSPECKGDGLISLLSLGLEIRPGVSMQDQAGNLVSLLGAPCSDTRQDHGRQQQVAWRRGANVIAVAEDAAAPNILAITFLATGLHPEGSDATEYDTLMHAFGQTLPAACLGSAQQ